VSEAAKNSDPRAIPTPDSDCIFHATTCQIFDDDHRAASPTEAAD
jgi:hypothetical protein